ncbi:MAG: tetratricopeptide repeat protein [Candidatus Coatesbacteria bacterium]|nr:MAG: tetratricopeptide repeat protein [Candidatus Coatesbacteria bacterium]
MPAKSIRLLLLILGALAAAAGGADRFAFSDARSLALGRAPVIDAGVYSLTLNPAFLVELPSLQFGFTHTQHPAPNTTAEFAGAALPLGDYGALGAGFGTLLVNNVAAYDDRGYSLGDFLYHDDRFAAGYAYRPWEWLAGGLAAHYDRHQTGPGEGATRTAFGLDVGGFLRTPPLFAGPFTLGVTGRNLVGTKRTTKLGEYQEEPLAGAAGLSWGRYFGDQRLLIVAGAPFNKPITLAVNAEVLIAARFAARAGALGTRYDDGEMETWPSGGAGYNTDLLSFDYCYQGRALGAFHYFSVSINPGRESRTAAEMRRRTEALLAEGMAYFEAGNYSLARSRFDEVLKRDPKNAQAKEHLVKAEYFVLMAEGDKYLKEQDWKRSREAFEEALKLVPEDFLATEYLDRVNQLEKEELARIAEEQRIREKLAAVEAANNRGNHKEAIKICQEILAAYPDNEDAAVLLEDSKRLFIASRPPPETPGEVPEEIPELVTPTIPPEAVRAYRQATGLLARGAVGQSINILTAILNEYPTYGAARTKLVEAYLLQGLEYYSKGALSSALQSWRRAQALDPGNAKANRYIKKAEREIQ